MHHPPAAPQLNSTRSDHPLLGGALDKANLQLFDMIAYQSLMGQLDRQVQRR